MNNTFEQISTQIEGRNSSNNLLLSLSLSIRNKSMDLAISGDINMREATFVGMQIVSAYFNVYSRRKTRV